ncbi:MAG TPA: tRNA pseudouridine(55) synthase TruB [Longimicrobiales bacterium]
MMTAGPTTADRSIDGVLPVDKPTGPTSHDVVARVRRALGIRRIGHTGTLDPFASGLLLLCIGRATRIAEYLIGMDKRYTAIVRLGIVTDTDDVTGSVIGGADPAGITCDAVERALGGLRGDIEQLPPLYSAKKVGGARAYAQAREGRALALEPVRVHIAGLTLTRCEPPELAVDVQCSSGTYVRAIARDLGAALGVGAHLTALRRTAIGPHRIERAVGLTVIEADPAAARAAVISMPDALPAMPRVLLSDEELARVTHGRTIPNAGALSGTVALVAGGDLVAIGDADAERVRPRKVFL